MRRTITLCVLLLAACAPAFAAPAASGHEAIARNWWIAASESQRETFVLAFIAAYQVGRNDSYYATLVPLDDLLVSTTNRAGHAALLRAVDKVRAAVPPVLFQSPASVYVAKITRFYRIAPNSLRSVNPGIVLICMAEGLDAARARFCIPIRELLRPQ